MNYLKVTCMENLKSVSVRLDARDIAALDEVSKLVSFYDRSDLIRAAVALMAVLCKDGRQRELLNFRPGMGDVLDHFEISYHREHG